MIKLLPRIQTESDNTRTLFIQCDIGRHEFLDDRTASCQFCRYNSEITAQNPFWDCRDKHNCSGGTQPWIRFQNSAELDIIDPETDLPYEDKYYSRTSVFRQVKFEGYPYQVTLNLAYGLEGQCNSNCWYHAWRLDNKKTWRQCGKTHGCGNNCSFFALMVPSNETLRQEFYDQF